MAKAKPIFIPGTAMQFDSASAAAKALGIDPSGIYRVLSGKRKTAGGYTFGYTKSKTIYVPQTGQTFATANQAAKALGVRKQRINDILSGRGNRKTVGGYNFVYADQNKLPSQTSDQQITKNQKGTKKQRIQKKKDKKVQKYNNARQKRIDIGIKSLSPEEIEEQKRNERFAKAQSDLRDYLKKINDKLKEYYDRHPNFINYSAIGAQVMGMQLTIGYTEDGYFDTSLNKFLNDEDLTRDKIDRLTAQLETLYARLQDITAMKKGEFWDLRYAQGTRAMFALEFGISQHQMDGYAYLIWDMLDVFERANEYEELGSDKLYNAVRDAMQGEIPDYKLSEFLENISEWMHGSRTQELEDIFSILDGYEPPDAGVWDAEGWTT